MNLRNTPTDYGSIAKWMHWVTVLFFLGSYTSVYYRHWFTVKETPENWIALQLHLSFGISIAVLTILRIVWRLSNRQPRPEPGARLLLLAAFLGHMMLYAFILIMVITGYVGTGVSTEYFLWFSIPKFEDTGLFNALVHDGLGMTFKDFEKPIDFIHKDVLGAWLMWMLILGHFLAAMYHHYVKKDRTLIKMTVGSSR